MQCRMVTRGPRARLRELQQLADMLQYLPLEELVLDTEMKIY